MTSHLGEPVNQQCPRENCNGQLVHNGNIFCENWGGGCDYALPHPQTTYQDQMVSWRAGGYWECELFNPDQWHHHLSEPTPDGNCPIPPKEKL